MKKSFYDWCIEHNRQDLLDRWDYELNNKSPENVGFRSNKGFYFKCPKNKHKSELAILAVIVLHDIPCECRACNLEINSFAKWCEEHKPYILDLWDYNKNIVSPYDIPSGTHAKYYFKCPKGKHDNILKSIGKITGRGDEIYCQVCDLEENSFGVWCENNNSMLLDLWDYEKNEQSPYEVLARSGKKYWFKCPRGIHDSSKKTLSNLTRYPDKFYCEACNSFGQAIIDNLGEDMLDLLWDYDKNVKSPFHVARCTSYEKVYIKCLEKESHGSYPIVPSNFWLGRGCPKCNQENHISKLQKAVERYIEEKYGYQISHEYACSIIARNPKTNRPLPYDNDVLISEKHLIIEVHGEQHYRATGLNKLNAKSSGSTAEETLRELQYRDRIKMEYVLSFPNYHYLALPCTSFEDGSYKTLIDNKILSLTIQN